jgi:hypothetical protein
VQKNPEANQAESQKKSGKRLGFGEMGWERMGGTVEPFRRKRRYGSFKAEHMGNNGWRVEYLDLLANEVHEAQVPVRLIEHCPLARSARRQVCIPRDNLAKFLPNYPFLFFCCGIQWLCGYFWTGKEVLPKSEWFSTGMKLVGFG